MEAIIEFAKHANVTVILALAMIAIILLLLDGNKGIFNMLKNIFKKQKLNTYKIEGSKATLDTIAKQLETIAGNHLHELPQISKDITEIKRTVGEIQNKQNTDSSRISKIEGFLKINV